jgi:hypothetical protein
MKRGYRTPIHGNHEKKGRPGEIYDYAYQTAFGTTDLMDRTNIENQTSTTSYNGMVIETPGTSYWPRTFAGKNTLL